MKSKRLPIGRAMGTRSSIRQPHWRTTALAFAAAMLLGSWTCDANALALGRVTVQSALGEPLRAEIDLPEISPDELASLKANVASPDTFRSHGLDYNPALVDVHVSLQKRSDGSYYLRVSSARAVNDPFIDLVLESRWASGSITRDYTMLFDPPAMRAQQQPLQAQTTPAPQAPSSTAPSSTAPSSTAPAPLPPAAEATGTASATPSAPAPASRTPAQAAAPSGDGKQVTVKAGDTAGKIAAANKPATVSLDQMLVAMLRANPDAFIGGNVNRVRAGAVLQVPGEQDASAIPADEAHRTIVAQSRDFNEFRRRVAENVPQSKATPAERQSSGKVTAQVEEKKPTANAPDKLTLSKGSAAGKAGAEEKIAQKRAAQDSAERVAELSKNIADLNSLGKPAATGNSTSAANGAKPGIPVPLGTPAATTVKTPATTAAPVVAMPAPTAAAPAVSPEPTPAATAESAASSPVIAAAPVSAVPASAATPPAAKAAVPAKATAKPAPLAGESSFVDNLLANPLALAGAGLIVLLAAGFGLYRFQQRKKTAAVDSSFLESRLQPDSFFGASGGQRIDTNESGVTGSSMVYSPSQLDAAGDVDPVAEADVYLAYGRDLQAEEILKEALRTQPQRVAIHAKLLEIYSKRRDAKAFELIATDAYRLTHGEGPDWEKICELGHELDPGNPLYRPGGQPAEGAVAAAAGGASAAGALGRTMHGVPAVAEPAPQPDIDLDLDFSLDDPVAGSDFSSAETQPLALSAASSPAAGGFERTQGMAAPAMPALDLDFGTGAAAAAAPVATLHAPDLVLDANNLNSPAAPAPAAPAKEGMLEFDLGSLSLDLPSTKKQAVSAAASATATATAGGPDSEDPSTAAPSLLPGGHDASGGDPLATKLALAQEFNAIGDPDGARTLAQEVIAEASGELKSAAQKFLAEIS